MNGVRLDSVSRQRVNPRTIRRIRPYLKPYRWAMLFLAIATAVDATITAATPLLLRMVIDDGILPRRPMIILVLALAIAGLGVVDAAALYTQTWFSSRLGQGVIYDLRTKVFEHVQRQPLAFFTRTQTGSLVSRLNTDVVGAQQAVTQLLSDSVATVLTLVLVIAAMFYLSWQLSLAALVFIPLLIFVGKRVGKRLQRLTREEMQLDAEIASVMNERFNVAGAILTKIFGLPETESRSFRQRAARVRDVTIVTNMYGRTLFIVAVALAAVISALVYGLGGSLVVDGAFRIGTLVAFISLLGRVYGPINQLTSIQANAMTALVSFDRLFELLDLEPLIAERPTARALPAAAASGTAPEVEFDQVRFRYPAPSEVSLASLESIALPVPERAEDAWVLQEVTFRAPAGKLTAIVGPSGAGKTTITYLVPRLYDPSSGTVRIAGRDLRDVSLRSLYDTVGMVTQDTYLFHDTIRRNLTYARADATEEEVIEACQAAQIWALISSLPNRLDTVVGDRGYRLSGGEKQRLAVARLLLKAPPVVVLDEATAHLDSESEAAIQLALKTALAGRTSLVIAHRLSTVREADQILVIDQGQVQECGTHQQLLADGRLYAQLYRTQLA